MSLVSHRLGRIRPKYYRDTEAVVLCPRTIEDRFPGLRSRERTVDNL